MKKVPTLFCGQNCVLILLWLAFLLKSFNGSAQTMSRPDQLFIRQGIQWQSWIRIDGASEDNKIQRTTVIAIGRQGRYIRIQAPHTDPLSLAEVEVFSGSTNVALGKSAQQSSNIDATHGLSSLAVDGNTDGNYANGSVTHTLDGNAAMEPWWQVDLGSTVAIDSIRIWNRTDCCDQRLKGFYLFVSNTVLNDTTLAGTITQTGVSWYTQPGVDHYPSGAELADIKLAPTYYERPMYNYTIHQMNPTAQWSLAKAPFSSGIRTPSSFEQSNGFLNSLQTADVGKLASVCFGDEEYYSTGLVSNLKSWYDIAKSKYPNVLLHNNQWFDQWDSSSYSYYIKTAQPDLITFDNYFLYGGGGNYHTQPIAGGSSYSPILGDFTKFRNVAMAGIDGAGKQPVAFGAYLQGFKGYRNGGTNNYYMSESELNINTYSFLLMGAKWLNIFRYIKGDCCTFTREDGSLTPQYWQYANLGAEVKNLSPHLSRLRSTDVRFIPGQYLSGGAAVTNPYPTKIAPWDNTVDPYVTGITATNLISATNNGLKGDVAIGYFKPVPGIDNTPGITMAPVTGKDVHYFMIMNGLIQSNGCCNGPGSPGISQDTIQGKANLCTQSIVLSIDFKNHPVDTLYRVRRSDGVVEMVNLTQVSGTQYSFSDTLDGGKADLFYWKNQGSLNSGIISGATYTLISDVNNASVLDVTGGATTDGTPVQLYHPNSSAAQQWVVTSAGNGFYKLQPVNAPGKALDVTGALSADGTQVDIYTDNGTNAQKWTITPVDGGFYNLSPACATGSNLDVFGGATADGTKVDIWGLNITPAQKWRFVQIAPPGGSSKATMAAKATALPLDDASAGVKLYPNPVTDGILNVDLSSPATANAAILIYDMTGKPVYNAVKNLGKGPGHIAIDVSSLPAGMYILQIKCADKTQQFKFIKPKN